MRKKRQKEKNVNEINSRGRVERNKRKCKENTKKVICAF